MNRKVSTGGAAYGIPKNTDTEPTRNPIKSPNEIRTIGGAIVFIKRNIAKHNMQESEKLVTSILGTNNNMKT